MIPLSLQEVAEVVHGRLVDADPTSLVTAEAFIDSREVVPGGLFVALPGERVDGHAYAEAAVTSGAAAALVTRPVGVPAVVVADTVTALGLLAQHIVAAVPGLSVIGLTGSHGKTGTKDLIAQLLEPTGPTIATLGNRNNEIGLPLTVSRLTTDTQYLVVEMGARGPGHIRYLCHLVRPTLGLVLNVGVAHIGEFGSQEGIAKAKGELVEAVPANGRILLNNDDPLVRAMRSRSDAGLLTFGSTQEADVWYSDVTLDAATHTRFTLHRGTDAAEIRLRLVGAHHAANATAAATVALSLGVPFHDVAAALETATPRSPWRMQVEATAAGVTIINDAYNSSPDSMRAALDTLSAMRPGPKGRRIAVLGEMAELGAAADSAHADAGRRVADLGVPLLVAVGEAARGLYDGAVHTSTTTEAVWVPDMTAAQEYLHGRLREGDVVLVKASHAVGLERLAMWLQQDLAPDADAPDADAPDADAQDETP